MGFSAQAQQAYDVAMGRPEKANYPWIHSISPTAARVLQKTGLSQPLLCHPLTMVPIWFWVFLIILLAVTFILTITYLAS